MLGFWYDRVPVSDDVTYTVDEAETLDDALADTLKVAPTLIACFIGGNQRPIRQSTPDSGIFIQVDVLDTF